MNFVLFQNNQKDVGPSNKTGLDFLRIVGRKNQFDNRINTVDPFCLENVTRDGFRGLTFVLLCNDKAPALHVRESLKYKR